MMPLYRLLLVLVALAIGAGNAAAQILGAASGDRVRVTAPTVSGKPIVGIVMERKQDTLVLRPMNDTRMAIAHGWIEKLERSTGIRRCSGILPGLLSGIILAAVVIATDDTGWGLLISPMAGVAGYAIGSIIARQFTCERWAVVPVPGR